MRTIATAPEMLAVSREARCAGRTIGLVPTMGYLHAGHLELIRRARAENDLVVMSIFVNPTQFGPTEDFDRYPRDLERDHGLAEQAGVEVLFVPELDVMYPGGAGDQFVWVDPGELARHLCGASRAGHFRGVATVVAKLFNLVQPDRAYFGQKDGQQAAIVTRMAAELAFPVEVVVAPTVREADGLALSSRNVYLTPEERRQAPALSTALRRAGQEIEAGERDPRRLEATIRAVVAASAPLARVDYVTAADARSLQPADAPIGDSLIALAVFFGETRLIDNLLVRFRDGRPEIS